jgi:2-polyprenyl-3-methyl-5-hydroxy-6-metoxy-1,4-benzoquinol methylase
VRLRYQSYSALKPIVNKYIPDKNAKILMVGCGTSNLGEDMFLDGYTNIVNTDVSPVCIEFMAKKHEKYHGMTCMPLSPHTRPLGALAFVKYEKEKVTWGLLLK